MIGYSFNNIGFENAYFASVGQSNMYFKTSKSFPRTKHGNPTGAVCLLKDAYSSGKLAMAAFEGAFWTSNVTFVNSDNSNANHGVWYANGNYALNEGNGMHGSLLNPEIVLHGAKVVSKVGDQPLPGDVEDHITLHFGSFLVLKKNEIQ